MFTGLVAEQGKVVSVTPNREGRLLKILSPTFVEEMKMGDSVAINGACQTVTSLESSCFEVQAVHTSLAKTTLGTLKIGHLVNLELALRPSDRMGGHIVQGHVNGVATLRRCSSQGENYLLDLELSSELLPYVVREGSGAIDGISLTVSDVRDERRIIRVSVIPHTWSATTLEGKKIGDQFNVEVDIIAKYVERLLGHNFNQKSELSFELLKEKGF